ncbi:MAG TPA: allantoinase AllB [Jatrophihabitantaceae bacterium]
MARVPAGAVVILSARRAVVDGAVRPCVVEVRDGVIAGLSERRPPEARDVVELAADEVLLPGLVDTHVHVNEPGRTEWEGFASATRAAAAGGVTTLIDMPLNSVPPTVDVPSLSVKRAAAEGQCHVDVGFWGGAVPSSIGHLRDLHDDGVFGFKAFLVHPGVDEFAPLTEAQLHDAMKEISDFDGLLLVHAEDPASIGEAHGRAYRDFLASRPSVAEVRAVERVIGGARATGVRAHVLHLASAAALPALAAARADGVRVSAETCPHYLTLTAEEIGDGATQFKCCPPIRDAGNRDALWQGLADGVIEVIVSDHSPAPPALKRLGDGDFGAAWGGIASLQLGLPIVWTQARTRGVGLPPIVRCMAEQPAELAGLRRKGRIAAGADADLVAFAPDETFTVDPARLHHRHPVTPYAGRELTGVVRRTWLRGRPVDDHPHGRLLVRGES